jgi:predicted amidophosphoribosyltransferase
LTPRLPRRLNQEHRCPVCQARWRGSRDCSRCGADLTPLMILSAQSWSLREAARTAIGAGQFERAFGLVAKAQETHRTPVGEALRLVVLSYMSYGNSECKAVPALLPNLQ